MEWLESLEPHYAWLALGLILAVAEIVIPGVFLIWLAGAAIIVGMLTWFVPIGIPLQVVIFAVLAIVAVFTGRRYLAANPVVAADPLMNDRGGRLVGEMVTVVGAIEQGSTGKVHYGDSEWLAKGPVAAVGAKMRVTGHQGSVLLVEPVAQPTGEAPQPAA
jgi:membrane protein implicated in regulation of membrane protease activity